MMEPKNRKKRRGEGRERMEWEHFPHTRRERERGGVGQQQSSRLLFVRPEGRVEKRSLKNAGFPSLSLFC